MFHNGGSSSAKQKKELWKKAIRIPRIADDPSPLSRNFRRQPEVPRCRCGAGVPQVIPPSNPTNDEPEASTFTTSPQPQLLRRGVVEDVRKKPSYPHETKAEVEVSATTTNLHSNLAFADDEAVALFCNVVRDGDVPLTSPDRTVLQQAVANGVLPGDVVDQILKMDFQERWPGQFQDVEALVEDLLKIYEQDPDQDFMLKMRGSMQGHHDFHTLFTYLGRDQLQRFENRIRRDRRKGTARIETKSDLVNELRYLLQTMVQSVTDPQDYEFGNDEALMNLDPDYIRKSMTTSFSNRFGDAEGEFLSGAVGTQGIVDLLSQVRHDGEERASRIGKSWLEFCRKDGLKVKEANLSKFSCLRDRASEIDRSSQLREMYNSLKERSSQIDEATLQLQQLAERKPESVASMQHLESIVAKKLEAEFRLEFRNETQQLVLKCSQERALHDKRLADALSVRAERASQLQRQLTELLKLHREWARRQLERLNEEVAECQKRKLTHEEKIEDLKKTIEGLQRKVPVAQQNMSQAYLSDAVRLQLRIELGKDNVAISFPSDDTVIAVAFAHVSDQEQKLFPRYALAVAMRLAQSKANANFADAVWEPAAFDPTRYQFDRVQKILEKTRRQYLKPVAIHRILFGPSLQRRLKRLADLFDAPAAGALAKGCTGGEEIANATPFQQLIFRAMHVVRDLVNTGGAESAPHLEAPLLVLVGLLFTLGRLLRCCKLLSLQLGCRALKLQSNALRGLLGKSSPEGVDGAVSTLDAHRKAQLLIAHGAKRMRSKLDEFRLTALPAIVRHYREIDEISKVMSDIVRTHEGRSGMDESSAGHHDIADLSALLSAVPRDEQGHELEEGSAALPLHVLQVLRYLRTMLRLQNVSRRWLCESLTVPRDSLAAISSQLDISRRLSQQALVDRNALRKQAAEASLLTGDDLWADLQKDLDEDTSDESEKDTDHEEEEEEEDDVIAAQEAKRSLYLEHMQQLKSERFFRRRVAGTHRRIPTQTIQRRHSAPGRLLDTLEQEIDPELRDCLSVGSSVASADRDTGDVCTTITRSRRRVSDPSGCPARVTAILHDRSAARKAEISAAKVEEIEVRHDSDSSAHEPSQKNDIEPQATGPAALRSKIARMRKLLRRQRYGGRKGGICKGTTARRPSEIAKVAVEHLREYVDVFVRTPAQPCRSNPQLNIDLDEKAGDEPWSPKTTPRRRLLTDQRLEHLPADVESALIVSPAPLIRPGFEEVPLTPRTEDGHNVPGTPSSEPASAIRWGSLDSSPACSRASSVTKIASPSDVSSEEDETREVQIVRPLSAPIHTRSPPALLWKEWDFGKVCQSLTESSHAKGFRRLLQRDFGSNDHTSPGFETSLSQCLRRKERPSSAHAGFSWRRKRQHRRPPFDEAMQRRYICLLAPGKTVESGISGFDHGQAPLVGKPLDIFKEIIRDRVGGHVKEKAWSKDSIGPGTIPLQHSKCDNDSSAADDNEDYDDNEDMNPDLRRVPTMIGEAEENLEKEQLVEEPCDESFLPDLKLCVVQGASTAVLVQDRKTCSDAIASVPNFEELHPGWTRISALADHPTKMGTESCYLENLQVVESPSRSSQIEVVQDMDAPMETCDHGRTNSFSRVCFSADASLAKDSGAQSLLVSKISDVVSVGCAHSDTVLGTETDRTDNRRSTEQKVLHDAMQFIDDIHLPSTSDTPRVEHQSSMQAAPILAQGTEGMERGEFEKVLADDRQQDSEIVMMPHTSHIDNRIFQARASIINMTEVCSAPMSEAIEGGDFSTSPSNLNAQEERQTPLSPLGFFLGSEDGFQRRQQTPCSKSNAKLLKRPLSAALASRHRSPSFICVEGAAQTSKAMSSRYQKRGSIVPGYIPKGGASRPMTAQNRPMSGRRSELRAIHTVAGVVAHRRIHQLRDLVASEKNYLPDVPDLAESPLVDVGRGWNVERQIIEERKPAKFR